MSSLLDATVQITHEELIKDGWRHTWLCTEEQPTAVEVYIKRVEYKTRFGLTAKHFIYNHKTGLLKVNSFGQLSGIEVTSMYELYDTVEKLTK